MVTNKQKGDKVEREIQHILEKKGFVVMKSPRTMRFIGPGRFISMANDYFGLYDLCAKKNKETFWIQAKSNINHVYEAQKKIAEFHLEYNCSNEYSEIWLRVAKKGFVTYVFNDLSKKWEKIFLDLKGEKKEPFKVCQNKKVMGK